MASARTGLLDSLREGRLTVTGPASRGDFFFDLSAGGELAPTILPARVKGRVELTGIAHLRGPAGGRLAALAAEINRLGHHHDTADSLVIERHPRCRRLHGF